MIRRKAIDRDQLFARLDDIKSRTKSSIEISRRLIEQSFLRFKATHRNLYAAQQSQEQLDALTERKDPAPEPSNHARTTERPDTLHSARREANATCDHCEGVLLNNKAFRVRTQDHGLILLDMVVCYACNLEAQNLGLETDELNAPDAESELTSQNNQVLALA